MTFHGHGFLPLELPDVAPLTSSVYSGFGFRSTQDSGLLYHRASPVCPPSLGLTACCSPSLTTQPTLPESHLCPLLPETNCSTVWGPCG